MLHAIDSGSGIPIVWIHGFPLCSEIFANQLSIPDARHIIVDLPGCGHTDHLPGDMMIRDYAMGVIELLDSMRVDKAVFAGLSMGGYVCFDIARLAMKRVRGLILIDTRETPDSPEARQGRYDTIEKVKKSGTSVVIDSMLPKMLSPAAYASTVAGVRRVMQTSSVDGVIAALHAMAEREDSSALLPKIKVPALVVVGDQDTITPPADAERMAKALPDAKLVKIRGAAHLSNVERPAEFNAAVTAFLKRVTG